MPRQCRFSCLFFFLLLVLLSAIDCQNSAAKNLCAKWKSAPPTILVMGHLPMIGEGMKFFIIDTNFTGFSVAASNFQEQNFGKTGPSLNLTNAALIDLKKPKIWPLEVAKPTNAMGAFLVQFPDDSSLNPGQSFIAIVTSNSKKLILVSMGDGLEIRAVELDPKQDVLPSNVIFNTAQIGIVRILQSQAYLTSYKIKGIGFEETADKKVPISLSANIEGGFISNERVYALNNAEQMLEIYNGAQVGKVSLADLLICAPKPKSWFTVLVSGLGVVLVVIILATIFLAMLAYKKRKGGLSQSRGLSKSSISVSTASTVAPSKCSPGFTSPSPHVKPSFETFAVQSRMSTATNTSTNSRSSSASSQRRISPQFLASSQMSAIGIDKSTRDTASTRQSRYTTTSGVSGYKYKLQMTVASKKPSQVMSQSGISNAFSCNNSRGNKDKSHVSTGTTPPKRHQQTPKEFKFTPPKDKATSKADHEDPGIPSQIEPIAIMSVRTDATKMPSNVSSSHL